MPPPGGGGKRGRDTKVSLPLLTPRPFLRTRLPSVARLKARGPQGRLVLQGPTLDGSEAFRSRTLPPCTVWPRTDSATDNAREIQGLTASQNLPDARNRAPFLPFRRATAGSRGAKEGLGESRGGKGTIRCPCPLLSSPGDPGTPRRRAAAFLSAVGTAFPSPPGDPGKAAQSYNFVTLQSLSVTQRTGRAPAVPAPTYRSRDGTRPP